MPDLPQAHCTHFLFNYRQEFVHSGQASAVEPIVSQRCLLQPPQLHLGVAVCGVSLQLVTQLGNRGGLVVSLNVLPPDRGSSSSSGLGVHL